MDRRERLFDPVGSMRQALQGAQAGIWTAMPGVVLSFDPSDMTCSVQVTIQAQVQDEQGNYQWVSLPPLIKCPVVVPGGGDWIVTIPVMPGTEVLVVFASRAIDSWWQSGELGPQVELRMHDLSDGFAIPGPRSVPRAVSDYSPDKLEIRSVDNSQKISLDHASGEITMTAVKVKVEGNLEVTGNVSMGGTVLNQGVNIGGTHRHPTTTNPSGTPL